MFVSVPISFLFSLASYIFDHGGSLSEVVASRTYASVENKPPQRIHSEFIDAVRRTFIENKSWNGERLTFIDTVSLYNLYVYLVAYIEN